jgi:transcription elongation GreA/GreB family factor
MSEKLDRVKLEIKNKLILQMKERLIEVQEVANNSHEFVKNGDLKSDGKYDTRSIEAGFLAGAQQKRVEQVKQDISLLESIDLRLGNQSVSIGSLVELELNKKRQTYFISSVSGGSLLNIEGIPVLVVSVFSPIGEGCIDRIVGDEFEVEIKDQLRVYSIKKIS